MRTRVLHPTYALNILTRPPALSSPIPTAASGPADGTPTTATHTRGVGRHQATAQARATLPVAPATPQDTRTLTSVPSLAARAPAGSSGRAIHQTALPIREGMVLRKPPEVSSTF